jgi:NAD(P)H-hydrate repair Nnr-like enzyme with NAD(P)H-hydrate epimerase domain
MHHASSQPIYSVAALREIEARHAGESPSLMERAGAAATRAVLAHSRGARLAPLIVCGPGNNGGDGFVWPASCAAAASIPPSSSPATRPGCRPMRARPSPASAAAARSAGEIPRKPFSLAVDALFGIGLQRPVEGLHADLADAINGLDCPVLALDVPERTVRRHRPRARLRRPGRRTATFIALKPGLLTLDGPDHCGEVSVHDLDLAPESLPAAQGRVATPALFATALRPRPKNSHKGMMGGVGILGGAPAWPARPCWPGAPR